jgi:lysozyme
MKFQITESEKKRIKDLYQINEFNWLTYFFDLLDADRPDDQEESPAESDPSDEKQKISNYNPKNIIEHIKKYEEFVGFTYDDAIYPPKKVKKGETCKGTCTIGYGTTDKNKARPGDTVSEQQASRWLQEVVNNTCIPCIERWQKRNNVKINKPIFDALIDVVYNKGCGGFTTSPIAEKLEKNDIKGAGQQLLKWQKWGNEKRREAVYNNFYKKGIK